MLLCQRSRFALFRCTESLERAHRSCNSRRLHVSRRLPAPAKPPRSPRIRDAERRSKTPGVRRNEDALDIDTSLLSMKFLTQAYMKKLIVIDPQLITAFLKEFAEQWAARGQEAKWLEELCQKYSMDPDTLYTIAVLPNLIPTTVPTQEQLSLVYKLLYSAALQGSTSAAIVLLQSPKVRKLVTRTTPLFEAIVNGASDGNQQAMLVLAMIHQIHGQLQDARRCLELAVGWPALASVGTSTTTTPPPITAQDLTLGFFGANEALRLLGQIYLDLHKASLPAPTPTSSTTNPKKPNKAIKSPPKPPPRSNAPDYLELAKSALTIAVTDLNDGQSYKHLLPLIPTSDRNRDSLVLSAAASGSELAWRELAGRQETSTSSSDEDRLDSLVSQSMSREKSASKTTDMKERWRQEWDVLLDRWESLEKKSAEEEVGSAS